MSFTSNIFLIGFLPVIILIFALLRKNPISRKVALLVVNSIFYLWGGIGAFFVVLAISICTWVFSVCCKTYKNKGLLTIGIIVLSTPLIVIKYTAFVVKTINELSGQVFAAPSMLVPLGISFFTFQAISCLIDSYRNDLKGKLAFLDVYLYLTFFATITSGPIMRIATFKKGLNEEIKLDLYGPGIERIAIGLCKKVLIADKMAILANYYFDGVAAGGSFSSIGLWLGAVAYTLQLYFDFSGYCDMAIGIGQLIGIHVPENFNYPYQSKSISEFWRKWHISLSQWFRDYIYIPLGGNRCSVPRHLLNMLIVWLITGIWHGADWSFVVWGLGYFILLVAEKYIPFMKKLGTKWFGHFYALFFINLLWIPFRADSLKTAGSYLGGMFLHGTGAGIEEKAKMFLPFVVVVVILCFPWKRFLSKIWESIWFGTLRRCAIVIITFIAICAMINATYVPYIYGNF